MSLPWPSQRVERLRALHRAGARPAEIAKALGVTPYAVGMKAYRIGVRFGPARQGGPKVRPKPAAPPPPAVLDLALVAAASCPHASARAVAAYLAHVELGYAKAGIGRALGVTGARIGQMVRLVEDRRDRPDFDEWLDDLGRQVREVAA